MTVVTFVCDVPRLHVVTCVYDVPRLHVQRDTVLVVTCVCDVPRLHVQRDTVLEEAFVKIMGSTENLEFIAASA